MNTIAARLVLLSMILVSACDGSVAQGTNDRTRVNLEGAGTLLLPGSVTLIEDPKRYPDFFIYDIRSSERNIVSIYLGNFPDISQRHRFRTVRFGDCVAKSFARASPSMPDRQDRDVEIVLSGDIFPQSVHFFYSNAPERFATEADTIIETFRPAAARQCTLRTP
jgi:hypothetical protein